MYSLSSVAPTIIYSYETHHHSKQQKTSHLVRVLSLSHIIRSKFQVDIPYTPTIRTSYILALLQMMIQVETEAQQHTPHTGDTKGKWALQTMHHQHHQHHQSLHVCPGAAVACDNQQRKSTAIPLTREMLRAEAGVTNHRPPPPPSLTLPSGTLTKTAASSREQMPRMYCTT